MLHCRVVPPDDQDGSVPSETAQSNGGSPDPTKKKDGEAPQDVETAGKTAGNGDQPRRNRWDRTEAVVVVYVL